MAEEHFKIKVSMAGVPGVEADSKRVARANRNMADSTDSVSASMRRNETASQNLTRSHASADRSSRSLSNTLRDTNARFTGLRNIIGTIKWPALIAGAGYAAQGLGTVSAAAIGLIGALAPLAGALAAYPALLGSLGQAAGVGALALSGIGNALGAMETSAAGAGAAATSSGKATEAAVEGVASAEKTLTQAQGASKLAQQSLTAARHEAVRELKDLKNAAIDASLGEERAAIGLREAKQSLRKAEGEPGHTGTELQSLELSVREARQSLQEARLGNARANGEAQRAAGRGVGHSPKVVESARSLHEAQAQVRESAESVRKAEKAVGEAMTEAAGGSNALNSALAKLSPSAQKFVHFLWDLKPRLDDLRQTAGSRFFPGLEGGLKSAMHLFPRVKDAVGATASVMGHLAQKAGDLVGSKGFGPDFSEIASSNTKIIGHLGNAGLKLADALRHVMVASIPLVDWMAKAGEGFADLIDKQAKAGRESGSLAHFFGETRSVMERLGSIIGSVASGLWEVSKAAKPLGDSILKSLDSSAQSFEDWTKSMRGQNALKTYFAEAKPGIFELGRLIRDVTKDFLGLSKGEGFYELTHALRVELLPVITEVLNTTTAAFGPALVKALVQVGKLLGNLAGTSGPLTLFVESVTSMIKLLNGAFDNIPGLKGLVVTLVGIATVSKALKFTGMVTGLTSAFGILKKIAATFGLIEAEQAATGGTGLLGGLAGAGGRRAATTVATDVGAYGEKQLLREAGLFGGGAAGVGLGARAASALPGLLGTGAGLAGVAGAAGVGAFLLNPDGGLLNPASTASAKTELDDIQKFKGLDFTKSRAQLASLYKGFQETMGKLRVSAGLGLGGVNAALHTGLDQASSLWRVGTGQWRDASARAMKDAVKEIRDGMKAGTIPARQGQQEIKRLLEEIHLVKGNDPFGLAEATTKQFREANEITAGGVTSWIRKLERMPKAAREKTIDSTNAMVKAWAQGHPKLEAQLDNLTDIEKQKFGSTNRQLQDSTARTMAHLAESAAEGATNVGAALGNIFDNLANALTAVGAQKVPRFSLTVLSTASQYHKAREGTQSGLGHPPRKAGGGITRVPGAGREDSVPLLANGAVSAVVAPGEDLMVVNRHQRPMLDFAVANTYGVGGMEGFYAANGRPHNFARGGEVVTHGHSAFAELGGRGAAMVQKSANAYLTSHSPQATGRGPGGGPVVVPGGKGTEMIDGKPVADWIAAILLRARGAGIDFTVSSGWRSYAEQEAIYNSGVRPAAVPGTSRHEGLIYPMGAVDISPGAEALAAWLLHSRYASTLIYAGAKDPVHFSHPTGGGYARGGFIPRLAAGGSVKGPWAGTSIDRTYAKSDGYTGATLPGYVIEALAEWAHLPGMTMRQITEGESMGHPGMDIPDPPGRSKGLYAVNDYWNPQFASSVEQRNPILNTLAASSLASASGGPNANIWHGSSHVTGWNLHYQGDPVAIARHLGGSGSTTTAGGATAKPSVPETASGHLKAHGTKAGGVVAPADFDVRTEKLTIPSTLPGTLAGVRQELNERRAQLSEYQVALRTTKSKASKKALAANVKILKERITALLDQQKKLMRQRQNEKTSARIAKRGTFPDIAALLASDEQAFARATEYSTHVVELEPETLSSAYAAQESSSLASELSIEGAWRNHLISADGIAWGREASMQQQLAVIEGLKKNNPDAYQRQKFRIPGLKSAIAGAQSSRADWREKLAEVQGPFGPQTLIPSLPTEPVPGAFGGDVWDTQTAIRDLGLKVSGAVEAAAAERSGIENELLRQRNDELEREARIHRAQEPVLADYLGAYLGGGKLPRDGYYFGHRGEEVVTRDAASAPAGIHVLEPHIHVSDELAPYISATIERRFEEGGRTVGLSLATPTAVGQRASMRGGL